MTTAKKAAAKSASIVDDEQAMVDKIAEDIQPEGAANTDLGMTPVADRSAVQDEDAVVRMVSVNGEEMDVEGAANVKIHERSGWKRKEEEA